MLACLSCMNASAQDEQDTLRIFRNNKRLFSVIKPLLNSSSLSTEAVKGKTLSAADASFKLGEVYCFPNPAKRQNPVFHIETGIAGKIELKIFDLAGDKVLETSISGMPSVIDDGHGPQYAYEYMWNVSGIGSGVYVFTMTAVKGSETLRSMGKCAVIK